MANRVLELIHIQKEELHSLLRMRSSKGSSSKEHGGHAFTHSHTCSCSTHSPTRTRGHAHTCWHTLDFQGGSHGLYLRASPSLSSVTAFLTVLFSGTEVQGLVLPVKGMALVCCFLESFSSATRSLWKVWVIRFVLVRKKTAYPSRLFKVHLRPEVLLLLARK